ncbi:PTS glucose transporter subunit IIA [Erysipelotrichaceae bacterium 51-3]|uniref:PTS sugar transporter subunit IIA n=1 Tax=Allobaculum sp. JKK-2023 TaxID=3108943 RepID=UPI002B0581B1|nr:PTS glucose transporter subunit IIA [Allobaculum sp. JKK-2023]
MFGFKKKVPQKSSKFEVLAPADGRLIDLGEVADQVFSSRMMGEGFAIVPENGKIYAPVSGSAVSVFPTGHAFGLHTPSGVEVLVHVGLDTVSLNGEGFHVKVSQGDEVKAGDLLVEFDPQVLQKHQLDSTTMVIFTDGFPSKIQVNPKMVNKGDRLIG